MPQNAQAATIGKNPSNAQATGQFDAQSAYWVTQRHSQGYAASYAGAMGIVANPSGVTTSAALATTYVGLCLSNPAGSGKNLSLVSASGALIVAPAALTLFSLIGGWSSAGVVTHTTALTPLNAKLGVAAPVLVGLADSAATLVGTPAYLAQLAVTPSATGVVAFNTDFDGNITIPPGGYVAIGTSIAGPASGFVGAFVWEEVAI